MVNFSLFSVKNLERKVRIFALFCLFAVIFHQGYSWSRVQGDSMYPTLKDGQKLLVDEWTYKFFLPEKNEIIILGDPDEEGDELVKRVIAVSGEKVQIKWGKIFIDDEELKDDFSDVSIIFYLDEEMTLFFNENENEFKVPEGYVWVIGDNRESSWYGLVSLEEIHGKVIF
jgi:signal peptidase I